MWKDLSAPWQEAVKLSWLSYSRNTIPIGAVVTTNDGEIVSYGRNRIFDKDSSHSLAGTYMAHAEMTAMSQLIEDQHPNIRSYSLYTTMEPCPMCFGTMLMMHLGKLLYGSRDSFAGATELKDKIEYTKNKKLDIEYVGGDLQIFQLVIQTAFEMKRNHPSVNLVLGSWREIDENAVELGIKLHFENFFETEEDISSIFDRVVNQYVEFQNKIVQNSR